MPDEPSTLKITLLGTGTSTGVPVIGCKCEVCGSGDSRDRRLRTSALVQVEHPDDPLSIVIDTGPDFRQQALTHEITRVDAVCYTHAHFDHIAGLDDLRPFFYRNKRPLPAYLRPSTAKRLRQTHAYVFTDRGYAGAPQVDLHEVTAPFQVTSRYDGITHIEVNPLEVYHGELPIYGYRIGNFAYLTDVSHIPQNTYEQLHNLDVLILDALRRKPHRTHFSVHEAVETARQIGADETYLIHLTHDFLHKEMEAELPEGIHLGYDGLTLTSSTESTPALSTSEVRT